MSHGAPDRKIGLVCFNHEVSVIGDGHLEQSTIAGDKLFNFDFLLENGEQEGQQRLVKPIKDTKAIL